MKIAIMSDLHTDITPYQYDYTLDADVVVVAGDSKEGGDVESLAPYVRDNRNVVMTMGNHEYYSHEINATRVAIKAAGAKHKVHVLDRDMRMINGVVFVGATLWTDFALNGLDTQDHAEWVVSRSMNDFNRMINYTDSRGVVGKFRTDLAKQIHYGDVEYIESVLSGTSGMKTVVVTHHAPSIQSVGKDYLRGRDAMCNAGYASNLEDLILKYQPTLWIHGHMHDAADYMIDKTRVISNPRGYARMGQNPGWQPIIVEI